MNRFAGSNDPDHFSVEGSGVVVRGLTFVRSEFNGRDTFSAGVYGQAINFADVPAELLGSVEVYKNTTAEMIEGGLAGTVNLNTRLPFDNKGFHVGFDVEANYGDLRKKMIADRFAPDQRHVGIPASAASACSPTFPIRSSCSRADGVQVTNFQTRDNVSIDAGSNTQRHLPSAATLAVEHRHCQHLPPAPAAASGTAYRALPPGADGFADLCRARAMRRSAASSAPKTINRERTGIAAAAQWESLDRRAHADGAVPAHGFDSNNWGEHTFESAPDLSEYNTYPAGCRTATARADHGSVTGTTRRRARAEFHGGPNTGQPAFQNYHYDANGVFEKGYITLPAPAGAAPPATAATPASPTGGMQQSLSDRQVDEENIVTDYGLNFKFKPDAHWEFNLDGDYTKAAA